MPQRLRGLQLDQREAALTQAYLVERGGRARLKALDVAWVQAGEHAAAILGVRRQRDLDGALIRQPLVVTDREVALVEIAALEARHERVEGRLGAGCDDDAGGVIVEAVHKARFARRETNAGHLRIASDERVGERAGLAWADRRARYASGFVEHDEVFALKQHGQRQRWLGHHALGGGVWQLDRDLSAGLG